MLTILDYYKSTNIPVLRNAGQFEALTDSSVCIYASLRNTEFDLNCNCFNFEPIGILGLKSLYEEYKYSLIPRSPILGRVIVLLCF